MGTVVLLSNRTYFPQRDGETCGQDDPSALCFVPRGAKGTERLSHVPSQNASTSTGRVRPEAQTHKRATVTCNRMKWSKHSLKGDKIVESQDQVIGVEKQFLSCIF